MVLDARKLRASAKGREKIFKGCALPFKKNKSRRLTEPLSGCSEPPSTINLLALRGIYERDN